MPEPTQDQMMLRVIEALEKSAQTNEQVLGQMKGLEREFGSLKSSSHQDLETLRSDMQRQLKDLEDEMRSMNSHLDNLVRETVTTNQLLREDMEDRKLVQETRAQFEADERAWRRNLEERKLNRKEELEDDQRHAIKKISSEMWLVFKQPFAYLVAGIIFYFLIYKLGVTPQLANPVMQITQTSTETPAEQTLEIQPEP